MLKILCSFVLKPFVRLFSAELRKVGTLNKLEPYIDLSQQQKTVDHIYQHDAAVMTSVFYISGLDS